MGDIGGFSDASRGFVPVQGWVSGTAVDLLGGMGGVGSGGLEDRWLRMGEGGGGVLSG